MTAREAAKLGPSSSLFNPDAPGALLMPPPPPFHSNRFNKSNQPVTEVVVDPHLSSCLRPHQREGVRFLYRCVTGMNEKGGAGAILADEMGLGKSLQAITLIWTLLKQGPYGRTPVVKSVLLVCPSSLTQNWAAEFRKWLGNERLKVFCLTKTSDLKEFHSTVALIPVLIVSYDLLIKCDPERMASVKFDLLVCDEGHRLKNSSIKCNCFLTALCIPRRVILSGTPVQNDLQELFTLIDFVSPGLLGSPKQFKMVYEDPIVRSHQSDACSEEREVGEARARQLNTVTAEILLRRTADINSKYLPPKAEYVLFCRPSDLQLRLFRQLCSSRLIERAAETGFTPQHLTCIDALRKLSNHPVILYNAARDSAQDKEDEKTVLKEVLPCFPEDFGEEVSVEDSGKLTVLMTLLTSIRSLNPPQKVVLVSNFTQTLNLIGSMCDCLGYKVLRLDGQTPTGQRQKLVKQFNSPYDDTFVFLLSTKAGGVGLNLVGASRLVLFDIDWNPANDLQAMARVWRDGQTNNCHIYRLITTGTIEEKMFQRQLKKQSLSGAVVTDSLVGKNAKGEGRLGFCAEELKDIFRVETETECGTHDAMDCSCGGQGNSETDPDNSQPRPTKSDKTSLSMAELHQWQHYGSKWLQAQGGTDTGDSCLPLSLPSVSFLFFHYTDKQDLDEADSED